MNKQIIIVSITHDLETYLGIKYNELYVSYKGGKVVDPKSIKIALLDGAIDGIVTIEEDNRNELLLSAPREAALELLKQPESRFFGVYLLLSEDCVYVGETTDYPTRIKNHLKEKSWWNRVVFLTTTDGKLTESHIKDIEATLIQRAKDNKKLDTDNSKSGNRTNVGRNDKIMIENYLNNIFFLLAFINVDVFSEKPSSNLNYYKMVDKNVALIDKNTVVEFLKDKGFTVGIHSYATLSTSGRQYAIDPSNNLLESDWTILLNDKSKCEIIIICVPAKAILKFGLNHFKVKNTTHKRIRMQGESLIDTSGFDFSKYIMNRISYSEDR